MQKTIFNLYYLTRIKFVYEAYMYVSFDRENMNNRRFGCSAFTGSRRFIFHVNAPTALWLWSGTKSGTPTRCTGFVCSTSVFEPADQLSFSHSLGPWRPSQYHHLGSFCHIFSHPERTLSSNLIPTCMRGCRCHQIAFCPDKWPRFCPKRDERRTMLRDPSREWFGTASHFVMAKANINNEKCRPPRQ